jgi:prepilin-type N-terminal cleavage/methylation domain-containing protein
MKTNNSPTTVHRSQTTVHRALRAFTLIEILVVVSIIAILAGLVLVSFSTPQKQANDTRRKNDLKQYAALLKEYAANNQGFYPCRTSTASTTGTFCTTDLGLSASDCPVDPKAGTSPYGYNYIAGTEGGGANCGTNGAPSASRFVLHARIEAATNTNFVICSNGKSGTTTTLTQYTNAVCPI